MDQICIPGVRSAQANNAYVLHFTRTFLNWNADAQKAYATYAKFGNRSRGGVSVRQPTFKMDEIANNSMTITLQSGLKLNLTTTESVANQIISGKYNNKCKQT